MLFGGGGSLRVLRHTITLNIEGNLLLSTNTEFQENLPKQLAPRENLFESTSFCSTGLKI